MRSPSCAALPFFFPLVIATNMANSLPVYPHRSAPPFTAHVNKDVNDTMGADVGTSVPLYEQVIGESSWVVERRVTTSNEMAEKIAYGCRRNKFFFFMTSILFLPAIVGGSLIITLLGPASPNLNY